MEAPKDRLPWTLAHPAPAAPASLPCAPASGQSGRSEPGTYLLCLQPCLLVCPLSHAAGSQEQCSPAIGPSHLPRSLAGSWNHHLGLRKHSQSNWTPRINYAALTKAKETLYSPLQSERKISVPLTINTL